MIAAALSLSLILIILAIAFFAASEASFLSMNEVHLKSLVRAEQSQTAALGEVSSAKSLTRVRHSKLALRLWSNMDNLLSLILIGTNLSDSAAASLFTAIVVKAFGSGALLAATLILTIVITVFGEIIPKTFALKDASHTDKVALFASPILLVLSTLFWPVTQMFSLLPRAILLLDRFLFPAPAKTAEEVEAETEAEIKMMLDCSTQEGTVEKSEREMIYKIFTLDGITVRAFMKHRSLVTSIPPEASFQEVCAAFAEGHSYIPVIEKDQVMGVLNYTCVLSEMNEKAGAVLGEVSSVPLDFTRRNMTEPLFIPETHTALEALSRFKDAHTDFAAVLDEQGAFSGIVTMDDLHRIVLQSLSDDSLSPAPSAVERVKVISSKECVLPGDMKIEDANELLGTRLYSASFTTIGGWLLEQFGSLPSIGEVCVREGMAFVVEDQEQRRILSVRVKTLPKDKQPEAEVQHTPAFVR